MALSFRRFSWLWFKDRDKPQFLQNSSANPPKPLTERDLPLRGEPENLIIPSSSSNTKRKWRSGEDRSKGINEEYYNLVLVPSDGLGYESDGSDWSIGWLEPHDPEFTSDDDGDDKDVADNSFAVLVPCYRHRGQSREMEENVPKVEFLSAVKNLPSDDDDSSGAKYHMERWLTSHYR